MSNGTIIVLTRLWRLLSGRRRLHIALLALCMLIGTALEMLSLGSVLPFLAVLIDPASVLQRPMLARIAAHLDITAPDELVTPLWAAFVGLSLATGAARLGLLWATNHATFVIGAELSTEVYRKTLYQPFSVHSASNSSQVISGITKKVAQTIQALQLLLIAITAGIVSIGITAALLLVDPVVALVGAAVFGGSYALVAWRTRRRLLDNSARLREASTRMVKTLQEGLGGIRDVLLEGTQQVHANAYSRVDRPLRRATASNIFIAASPRVLLEAFGVAAIATFAYVLTQRQDSATSLLPTLGVLAMGAQRLLPAFQQVYAGYASLVGNQASIADIVTMLEQPLPAHAFEPPPPPLNFQSEVRFEHVQFRYPNTEAWVLSDFNLVIPKGARVGFVGKTGGGKSTALDLLMGLLEPTHGQVQVDGKPLIGTHCRAWQRVIAHVPQTIFLSDTTIAENIAFGLPVQKINMDRVREAARIANIADYIESQPDAYKSVVGERGVRLSGGQRQRIGIARALYRQASVLVLDEATSALDNSTERALMDAIESLSRDLTIVMIAHRLTTVERCDMIVVFDQGRVSATGTYAELMANSEIFRTLAAHPTEVVA